MKYQALNFEEKLGLFDEQWAPKVIAEMNEYQFKIVKIKGDFVWHDHKDTDDLEGLISLIGGKATTLRAMAEKTADLICHKTGRNIACQTANKKLLHYRQFYKKK